MKIAAIGKGNVGGGLADLWERAGHEVTRIGRGGGEGFASNAEYVKSRTNGPTAKSFNINFAALQDRLGKTRSQPSNLWCGDEEAREVVERLSRDAGYEPVCAGPLENAAKVEAAIGLIFEISKAGTGQFFYRMAAPENF
jgi:predicted dinucleotide-binding enzyme